MLFFTVTLDTTLLNLGCADGEETKKIIIIIKHKKGLRKLSISLKIDSRLFGCTSDIHERCHGERHPGSEGHSRDHQAPPLFLWPENIHRHCLIPWRTLSASLLVLERGITGRGSAEQRPKLSSMVCRFQDDQKRAEEATVDFDVRLPMKNCMSLILHI